MNQNSFDPTSRRSWLRRAAAALSTIALARAVPEADLPAAAVGPTCPMTGGLPGAGAALPEIGEIASGPDRLLKATITVEDDIRAVWLPAANPADPFTAPAPLLCSESQPMRYFAGAPTGGKRVWPTVKGAPGPGPTLRARIGDT